MPNAKDKRGGKPPHASWTTVREELVLSLVHAYRMYLEAATLTEQEERRARNIKSAERVRGELRALIPHSQLGPIMRHCLSNELNYLDARRAALRADALTQALSLMYGARAAQQSAPPETVGEG
jgi:GAF domain-containing protein